MEEGGGGEVREGAADSSKGDARSRGGLCVGEGERIGATYKRTPVQDTRDSRRKWLRWCALPEDLMVWPQKGRKEQGEWMQASGHGNLFSIRTAGKLPTRSFVS